MQQLENDLDQTQEKLMNANQRLEEKEKALQNVSHLPPLNWFLPFFSLSKIQPGAGTISSHELTFHSVTLEWNNSLLRLGMKFEKAKEEVEALEKKMQQLENELSQTQTNLETATKNLEEKEKALQNVSLDVLLRIS